MARPGRISRKSVVDAAYLRVSEGGLEALSMRGLGKDLGVEAMSLYKHVGKREDLIALLRTEIFSSLELPARGRSARRDLEEICQVLFRGLGAKQGAPFLLPLPLTVAADEAPESGVGFRGAADSAASLWFPIVERMLLPLRELIPEPLDRAYAVHALLSFVLGQVVFAARSGSIAGHPLSAVERTAERFPEIGLIFQALQTRSPEVEFELGLRALLDSIEARRGF